MKPGRDTVNIGGSGGARPRDLLAAPDHYFAARDTRYGSRGRNREFRKRREVSSVVGVDSLDAIRQHGRRDVHVEHVAARHWMAAEQVEQPVNRVRRNRQHPQKRQQVDDRSQGFGGGARVGNAARIGHDGIKLAEYLRGHVECSRRIGARRVEQSARGGMLRSVGIERVDQDIRIDDSRFNGHRRRDRADEERLCFQGARPAIQDEVERAGSAPRVR